VLAPESETGFFTLEASIALTEPWGSAPLSLSRWLEVRTVVDSGASRTAISDQAARILGVPVESLERGPISGATGAGTRPFIRNLFLRLPAPGCRPIRLDKVTVLHRSLETPEPTAASSSRVGRVAWRDLNTLGTDIARILGARLTLDYLALTGDLSW